VRIEYEVQAAAKGKNGVVELREGK